MDYPDLPRLIGIAVIVLAVIAPVSYCTVRTEESKVALHRGCIEAKGEWVNGWSGSYCDLGKDSK